MKTTFRQAKQRIDELAANYHDATIRLNEMSFYDLDSLRMASQEIQVLPSAQRLFANRLSVPYSYLARCSSELQANNLNYWLKREEQERDALFCRFDGAKLRAVFTDRYKAFDNQEIMEKMVAYGFNPDTEVHFQLSSSLMVMKIPDYERMFFIGQERLTPGIAVSNSEVGLLAFSIEAYFYRLVCTNGLISKTQVASKFRHVSSRALEEFHDIIGQVVYESRQNQATLTSTAEQAVENPPATISSFNRQFQLTKKEAEAVEQAWEVEPGQTMFQVINAYTRAAQDQELSSEESNKLERVGGQILALVR